MYVFERSEKLQKELLYNYITYVGDYAFTFLNGIWLLCKE